MRFFKHATILHGCAVGGGLITYAGTLRFHQAAIRGPDLRQTEIQNLSVAPLRGEDIRRFDVAMNYAFTMGRIETISNLNGNREQRG